VGAHAAIMGVSVQDDSTGSNGQGGFGNSSSGDGAFVKDVQSGSGADDAGITSGSTITQVDGNTVTSATQLTHLMVPYQPGDQVKVQWTDASGQSHSATIDLGSSTPS